MVSCLAAVLVACIASVVSSVTSPPISWDIQDADSVELAIDFYNKEQNETSIFKLLDVDNTYRLGKPINLQWLKFRIKETVCQKTETRNTEECEFKEDGLVKDCSAYVIYESGAIIITCEPVDKQKTRQKRFIRKRKKIHVGMFTLIGHVDKKKNDRIIWAK